MKTIRKSRRSRQTRKAPKRPLQRVVSCRCLAKQIASKLLREYTGNKAKRLVLEMPEKYYDGSGWCEEAIVDLISNKLKAANSKLCGGKNDL